MSGQRPSTTGCYLNEQNWRPGISEDKLLNSQFFKAGYRVYGAGKIYHGAADRGGKWTEYFAGDAKPNSAENLDGVGGLRFGKLSIRDEDMPDDRVVSYGLKKLKEKSDQPFFLAVGLVKPHLPFAVPKKWFDMFPLDSIELPPHRDDDLDDVPPAGVKMARPDGDHKRVLRSGRWKEVVQAYLASIAFCDSQVGRLLDGLEASPYRDNTIVVLWSDHGWSLGEKSHWRKFALWEEPTRTVFAWRVPGHTHPGGACSRAVDFTCIYPTLCELTGQPLPSRLEGRSVVPLLKNPQAAWDFPAVTTHGFKNHVVRTDGWRYIRYANGDEELYDDDHDPLEYTNLANEAKYADRKTELAKWLPKSDAPSLPTTRGRAKQARAMAKSAGDN
jgi:arylsulfatase A-like enzyme